MRRRIWTGYTVQRRQQQKLEPALRGGGTMLNWEQQSYPSTVVHGQIKNRRT